ncbi:MAG: hypothetical protein H0X38_13575 [Planctomycetes bacterium]|nr:hypothetical protein [Planctomycetota bacterium]
MMITILWILLAWIGLCLLATLVAVGLLRGGQAASEEFQGGALEPATAGFARTTRTIKVR